MEEKDQLRLKFFRHIVYNIAIFLIFFVIFGLLVFFMIRNNIYANVDQELYESRRQILEIDSLQSSLFIKSRILKEDENFIPFEDNINTNSSYAIIKNLVNPNITVIVRDFEGNIINDEFGRLEEYIDELSFNSKNLDKIYELVLGKEYFYRGINFIFENENEEDNVYVQLLINIDSEKNLVDSYFKIISSAATLVCIISFFASYIMSKKTLTPLRDSIFRQMEFVQNVSHELRTPLTIIQAKQELLLQEPNAKIIDKSEDIVLTLNETKRLSKLVKDLLMLSRADTNKMTLQKENVNIDEYIKEIVAPYTEIAEMQEKEIILNLNYKMDIDIDTNKIYQLMIILLDNAIKYTEPKDKIEIETYLKDNKCIIEVKDTGIGVSDEGLKRIFERFYREDKARNRETGGSGLGLSIANLIVTAHGGTIKASHNQPKGTVFSIRLPR